MDGSPQDGGRVDPGATVPLLDEIGARGLDRAEELVDELTLLAGELVPLVLEIGAVRSRWSRYPDGDLTRVIFSLPAAAFAAAPDGERVRVRYASNAMREWDFGAVHSASRLPRNGAGPGGPQPG